MINANGGSLSFLFAGSWLISPISLPLSQVRIIRNNNGVDVTSQQVTGTQVSLKKHLDGYNFDFDGLREEGEREGGGWGAKGGRTMNVCA